MEEARKLIAELVDPDDCQYDHNDLCQTHGCSERPCPHERAKRWLAEYPATPATESITVPYLQFCNLDHCSVEERAVIDAVSWWHAEINRIRSTSAIHVALEDHEQELFATASTLLAARAKERK